MSNYEEHLAQDARLVILKELAKQPDGTLHSGLLTTVLDLFGHRRSREWVSTQLAKLAELGAVRLAEQGTVTVATITRAGRDHVEMRAFVAGVSRPTPE
jgi:hypothetical protein